MAAEKVSRKRQNEFGGKVVWKVPTRFVKRYVLVAFVVLMAGFVASSIILGLHSRRSATTTFNKHVWKRHVAYCTKSPRGRMVEEVAATYLRPGMSMSSARALLGPADEISPDSTWLYNVDYEPDGLLGTCVALQLYTKGDLLQRAEVTRDD